jgi:hypothetical protein
LGRVYFDAGGGRGVEGTAERREEEEKVREAVEGLEKEKVDREREWNAVRRLIVIV